MSSSPYQDDNFEELLLNNEFYSSNVSDSQNHLSNLRNSVQIKNSLSSTSINRGLTLHEKTAIMKNSPSMKALEKILNEKSKQLVSKSGTIEEGDEEEEAENKSEVQVETNQNEIGSKDQRSVDITRVLKGGDMGGSTVSFQSFETAKTRSSLVASTHSISTIEEGDIYEATPTIIQSATVLPLRDQRETAVATTSHNNVEKEPELKEKDQLNKKEDENDRPVSMIPKTKSMISEDIGLNLKSISPRDKALPKIVQEPESPVTKSMIPPQNEKENQQTKRSPHIRSNSTFSFSFKKDKEEKPMGRPKRSSTLGDISKINNINTQKETPVEKKKFSFRSLFKSKSKNHSLDKFHQDEIAKQKPNVKSFSSPDISKLANKPNTSTVNNKTATSKQDINEKKQFSVFKKNKPDDNLTKIEHYSHAVKESKPGSMILEDGFEVAVKPTSTSKAMKSNTNLNFIREVTDDTETTELDKSIQNYTRAQKNTQDDSFPDSDCDEYDSKNLLNNPPKILSNSRYDEEISLLPDSSPIARLDAEPISFGSPFEIYYKSSSPNLSIPQEANNNLEQLRKKDEVKNSNQQKEKKVNDQLLGEALFPKTLSEQEVDSIVSLERTRSMKSITSHKRSSFVNYDGSDDNIQYKGSTPDSSRTLPRSGSILKNSSYSLNVNEMDHVFNLDSTIESTMVPHNKTSERSQIITDEISDSYAELLEFSDFIDFDNLSLLGSPLQDHTLQSISESPGPHIVVTTPPSSNNETQQTQSPTLNSNVLAYVPLTPNLEAIETAKTPSSPQSLKSIEKSPNTSSVIEETHLVNNRPISMSFKGLKGPSFGRSLASQNLRTSDSHQSFNLSFGDEDTDYSGSLVGGGFGTSDDDYESDSEDEDKENLQSSFSSSIKELAPPSHKFGSNLNANISTNLTPPKKFVHNKIPSFSDNSNASSPSSLSSFISRKVKSPKIGFSSPFVNEPKNTVKFSSRIILYDTYSCDDYDRHPDTATCNQLTPLLAQKIKEELNVLKSTMEVHEDSHCFTHFL